MKTQTGRGRLRSKRTEEKGLTREDTLGLQIKDGGIEEGLNLLEVIGRRSAEERLHNGLKDCKVEEVSRSHVQHPL